MMYTTKSVPNIRTGFQAPQQFLADDVQTIKQPKKRSLQYIHRIEAFITVAAVLFPILMSREQSMYN